MLCGTDGGATNWRTDTRTSYVWTIAASCCTIPLKRSTTTTSMLTLSMATNKRMPLYQLKVWYFILFFYAYSLEAIIVSGCWDSITVMTSVSSFWSYECECVLRDFNENERKDSFFCESILWWLIIWLRHFIKAPSAHQFIDLLIFTRISPSHESGILSFTQFT